MRFALEFPSVDIFVYERIDNILTMTLVETLFDQSF